MAYTALNMLAYDHLLGMIYNRELSFNTIYSETKLAANLSISRTPMRDALIRLARERYIDILPNRGFMLHKPNEQEIIEAYHVRMMIEGYCAEILAGDYPQEDAQNAVACMEEAAERQQTLMAERDHYTLNDFWQADRSFHKTMLDYLNVSSFNLQYDSFMHIFMPHYMMDNEITPASSARVFNRHLSTLKEHAMIVEALKSGNPARAKAAIRRHLDTSIYVLLPSADTQAFMARTGAVDARRTKADPESSAGR